MTLVTLKTWLQTTALNLSPRVGKVVHKKMRRAVKQRSGTLVHAMGDGSTSSVVGVPRGTDDDDNDIHID